MIQELYPFWWDGATTIGITALIIDSTANTAAATFDKADVHLSPEGVAYTNEEWGSGFIPWSHVINITKAS